MTQYKTPGVYVVEKDAFGSSIVANETAIPVFFGYTEKMKYPSGEDLRHVEGSEKVHIPVRIRSTLEYEQSFGGPDTTGTIKIQEVTESGRQLYTSQIVDDEGNPYTPGLLHPSVANFFGNGGNNCYIVSLGTYEDFQKEDPNFTFEALKNAIEMADDSTLLVPTDLIRFGPASYYGWCNQLVNYCEESNRHFCILDVFMADDQSSQLNHEDIDQYRKLVTPEVPKNAATYFPYLKSLTPYAYDKVTLGDQQILPTDDETPPEIPWEKIQNIRSYLATHFINMPPSPFMAGIYSRVDNSSGVWTPPANIAPNGVSGPLVDLTNLQQESLNVDAIAGKSINAIRRFTGKGTLVWGARTNDGNSMDWRYINVRRLFISMETDISMALEAYVFKPNVHNTWIEVRTMIDSYLFGLYQQGAFAGTTPESSYQVHIGLGETMTEQDILDGYMRATIMVAPVRPAEFIELTFTQMVSS